MSMKKSIRITDELWNYSTEYKLSFVVLEFSLVHSIIYLKKTYLYVIEIVIELHMYVHTKLWCRHIIGSKYT